MRHFLAIAALGALLPGCEQAPIETHTDPVVVTAQVERAQVTPGRPFELSVEINRRDDVEFRLPDLGAGIQGLVIMELREEGPERAAGRVLSRTIYKLKAPLSGTYLIPGAEAAWTAANGQTGRAGSGPILIEAAHAAGEEGSGVGELRDIKAARAPPIHWPPFVLVGLLAVLLLVTVLLVRRARRGELPVPQRSPREIALQELEQLRRAQRSGATEQGPFAYEVSAILRRYLEAVFGFPAWRMTTAELLRAMPRELLDRRKVEVAIREVLEASDLVKFAGEQVPDTVLQLWVDQAAGVVRDTAPIPTPGETTSTAEAGP
jgi:hypothetical protein